MATGFLVAYHRPLNACVLPFEVGRPLVFGSCSRSAEARDWSGRPTWRTALKRGIQHDCWIFSCRRSQVIGMTSRRVIPDTEGGSSRLAFAGTIQMAESFG